MPQRFQIFKCSICGNIVNVLHAGEGQLSCCGQPMNLLIENTIDAAKEKHIPVVKNIADGVSVKVGAVSHPMEEKHFIEWVEVIIDNRIYQQFLKPGDAPQAVYPVKGDQITARAYCNLHGLWKK